MTVPGWWQTILLIGAAYRSWRIAAVDEIGDRPRNWLLDHLPWIQKWLECPWCAGGWFAVGWWVAWLIRPHGTLVAAAPFTISLAAGLTARNLDP
jgi:hypothetical protein